jgi:hypothetical protein
MAAWTYRIWLFPSENMVNHGFKLGDCVSGYESIVAESSLSDDSELINFWHQSQLASIQNVVALQFERVDTWRSDCSSYSNRSSIQIDVCGDDVQIKLDMRSANESDIEAVYKLAKQCSCYFIVRPYAKIVDLSFDEFFKDVISSDANKWQKALKGTQLNP